MSSSLISELTFNYDDWKTYQPFMGKCLA